jgi:hypothetical protein
MPNVNASCGLVAALGLGTVCWPVARRLPPPSPAAIPASIDTRCRSGRPGIRGDPQDSNCYRFVYQDGHRARGLCGRRAEPDPTSEVATIRISIDGFEKRVFTGTASRRRPITTGPASRAPVRRQGKSGEWRNLGADDRQTRDSSLAIFRWRYDPQGQPLEEPPGQRA